MGDVRWNNEITVETNISRNVFPGVLILIKV